MQQYILKTQEKHPNETQLSHESNECGANVNQTINEDASCSRHFTDEGQFIVILETIDDLLNETVAGAILDSAYNLKEMIENINKQSCNRSFNAVDMVYLSKMSDALVIEDNFECDDQTIKSNLILLERQLAGIGLQIDPVKRDGDCAFRSIVRELKQRVAGNSIITNHMNLLQLPQDEDSATFHLRQLFVNELEKEGSEASNFISGTTEEVAQKARAFRLQGVCLIETLEI